MAEDSCASGNRGRGAEITDFEKVISNFVGTLSLSISLSMEKKVFKLLKNESFYQQMKLRLPFLNANQLKWIKSTYYNNIT